MRTSTYVETLVVGVVMGLSLKWLGAVFITSAAFAFGYLGLHTILTSLDEIKAAIKKGREDE